MNYKKRQVTETNCYWVNKNKKRCTTSLVIKLLQSKSFYYHKIWSVCEEVKKQKKSWTSSKVKTGAAIVDKNSGVLSEKLHIFPKWNSTPFVYNVDITLTWIHDGNWIGLLTGASFGKTRGWKQPSCSSVVKWINKMHASLELKAIALWKDFKNTFSSEKKK